MARGKMTIRIGAGSAHEGDDLPAAQLLAERGDLDYLVFDCQSEVALIKAYLRQENQLPGYDVLFEHKLRTVLEPCAKRDTKIIANAGILDPKGAAEAIAKVCRDLGLRGRRIAYVSGGDVSDQLRRDNPMIDELGKTVSELGNSFVGAIAYSGARQIVDALATGADIVVTARAGDSEQYLAPMMHEFGWGFEDWDKIGRGLGLGHLLECSAQLSGGCYVDGARKVADGLDRLGFPLAEVDADGSAIITKIAGTGGTINEQTCKEQLVYEIGDPTAYIHADGIVDFTTTRIRQIGKDRVRVDGTTGHRRTGQVKVGIAVREGFIGIARILFGGTGAYDRARLAADIVTTQLATRHDISPAQLRCDFIGYNALFDWGIDPALIKEVELRVSGRFATKSEASQVLTAVALLPCNGPSGSTWPRPSEQGGIEEVMGFYSTLLPQADVKYQTDELKS